ncbi:MAG: GIY-YIG nuclease family protein [Candidatus Abawacabacteria bacterium]|nr:GIY-YIG nuclease family protein [Candidatus Abawacabacteria bacterium]
MRFAIVDIETTGSRLSQDRVLEIGVLVIENNKLQKTFTTLINPRQYIPEMISELTGITSHDVKDAPLFQDVAQELLDTLEGAVFVAHNVAFDYGFIRAEFERMGITFQAKTLCTVRLSRKLFPEYTRHSLSHLIDRFNISTEARHRALADAQALWDFLQILGQRFEPQFLEQAITEIIKTQRVPPQLAPHLIRDLPKGPGVYIFYDHENTPLYIGKSINIQERVKQHFQNSVRSSKAMKIFTSLAKIETVPTAGELGALLLESKLIKEKFPLYNHQLRRVKKLFVLFKVVDSHGYWSVKGDYIEEISTTDLEKVMGVFTSQKQAQDCLLFLSSEHQLCQKLLNLQKTTGCCFGYHIKRCKGSCLQQEPIEEYNARVIRAFEKTRIAQWPYDGAITIEESSNDGYLKETFTIDRWCITSHMNNDRLFPLVDQTQKFNLDQYKIIYSHIKRGKVTLI